MGQYFMIFDVIAHATKITVPELGEFETDNPVVEKVIAVALVIGVVGYVAKTAYELIKPNEKQ